MSELEIVVELGDGAGGQQPLRFGRPGAMRPVDEVLDRWPGDGYVYFKLRSAGELIILRHDEDRGLWQLHFYARDEST